ncbi:unnamed protein product [Cyprideis torosa]|uniref:Peptidyl-prolyl cis-trans isomerase n=1 Tax=Cyprideis torosa TaxID=163714 RepID=A0A7R8WDK0_9CRUS|nr:unnamed protein product [Cyprideis torosa]CAG0894823.1 unnamed protein product [Cyprideis torosa]
MQYKVSSEVDATPQEVQQFYEQNKSLLPKVPEEIELAHIVFEPLFSKENREKVIDKLKEIRQDILDGSSFSTKALVYSEDPGSSSNGGLYEKVRRGKFVKEFEEVAFTLKEGEISQPFKTEYGYHIVMLDKRRVTIKCHEDNSFVAKKVKQAGNGKVLVVDGGGSLRRALLGDNLARHAYENGWAGIVIYGCLRDSAIINEMPIGVYQTVAEVSWTESVDPDGDEVLYDVFIDDNLELVPTMMEVEVEEEILLRILPYR